MLSGSVGKVPGQGHAVVGEHRRHLSPLRCGGRCARLKLHKNGPGPALPVWRWPRGPERGSPVAGSARGHGRRNEAADGVTGRPHTDKHRRSSNALRTTAPAVTLKHFAPIWGAKCAPASHSPSVTWNSKMTIKDPATRFLLNHGYTPTGEKIRRKHWSPEKERMRRRRLKAARTIKARASALGLEVRR